MWNHGEIGEPGIQERCPGFAGGPHLQTYVEKGLWVSLLVFSASVFLQTDSWLEGYLQMMGEALESTEASKTHFISPEHLVWESQAPSCFQFLELFPQIPMIILAIMTAIKTS